MWLLPSLGRPKEAWEVAKLAPDVEIVLRLHRQDPALQDYLKYDWPKGWRIVVGKIAKLRDCFNSAFAKYPDEAFYGFIADDIRPMSEGWAEKLVTAAGQNMVAYPDDGYRGEDLCTHPCIGGDLVRAVGWWCLPTVEHSYFDTVWMLLAMGTDRLRYVPEAKLEHRHPMASKGVDDDTYEVGQESYLRDREAYHVWTRKGGYAETIRKLNGNV